MFLVSNISLTEVENEMEEDNDDTAVVSPMASPTDVGILMEIDNKIDGVWLKTTHSIYIYDMQKENK